MSVEEREQRWTEAMHAERRGKAVACQRILKEVPTALRYLGMNTTWYLHSHLLWLRPRNRPS
jgi:hypothetical protein